MRNKQGVQVKSKRRKTDRRTKEEIKVDILKAIQHALDLDQTPIKRTGIANACNINYTSAVYYTNRMERDEATITRDSSGFYGLTQLGKDTLQKRKLNEVEITEIVKIAKEIATMNTNDINSEKTRLREIFGIECE